MAGSVKKFDPVEFAAKKKAKSDLKSLPSANNATAIKARLDQIEKILGLA